MTATTPTATRTIQPADKLLCQVANGDRESFSMLYAATSARVYGLVRKVLIDVGQSEEVTQEVFLEVWQLASRFDPARASAIAWMLAIAHNRAIDRVRSSQSSRTRDLKVGIRDHLDPGNDVMEQVEVRLEHDRARRALRCLSTIQREAITLAYWEGLTVDEIAMRLRVNKRTVTSRIRDGLFRLRHEMEKDKVAGTLFDHRVMGGPRVNRYDESAPL
jgi:RNA polymerase sigma-70 factor, ECF subfamily